MSALKHKDTAVLTANRVKIIEKIRESAISVLPIVVIVLVLCLTIAPVGTDLLLCFLIGTIFVVVGMGLFSLGAEASMTPIGNRIGMALTKTRNLPLILIVSFMLGFAVTIAEPDLQVPVSYTHLTRPRQYPTSITPYCWSPLASALDFSFPYACCASLPA
mgnify:CR=1 FL=1